VAAITFLGNLLKGYGVVLRREKQQKNQDSERSVIRKPQRLQEQQSLLQLRHWGHELKSSRHFAILAHDLNSRERMHLIDFSKTILNGVSCLKSQVLER
jgi:hypothetical protein